MEKGPSQEKIRLQGSGIQSKLPSSASREARIDDWKMGTHENARPCMHTGRPEMRRFRGGAAGGGWNC